METLTLLAAPAAAAQPVQTRAGHDGCAGCRNRGPACGNCVVTVLLGAPGLPDFDDEERAAIAALAGQGLVPPLRLAPARAA